MKNRTGQRIGCYLVVADTGKRTSRGKPIWLAQSVADGSTREVTEHKLIRIGKSAGFDDRPDVTPAQ